MPAIDLSATPYYSMVISLAKSPLFSIAIHPMSVVHCKKVNRLGQVCHHCGHPGTAGLPPFIFFSTSYPKWTLPCDVLCLGLATAGGITRLASHF